MTSERIAELKAKYGKIFKITISDVEWFYRAMTRDEFKKYTREQSQSQVELTQADLEDIVFSMCNLNDITREQIKTLPAGIPATIADLIMKATGFTEIQEPVEL